MGMFDRFIKTKSIPRVPSLSSSDVVLETYTSKEAQIKANTNAVATANNAISESVASVRLYLNKVQGGKIVRIDEHQILDLLNNPNDYTTGEQMRQLWSTYMNLVGESYLMKLGGGKLPDSLVTLPAQSVTFKVDKNDYEDSEIVFQGKKYPIAEIIRGINPDPSSPFEGRSIIKSGAQIIGIDTKSKEWNHSFYANSAKPNMVVKVPDEMSDDVFNRFKQQFNETFVGSDNNGKPLIIEGGAEVAQFMVNQKEMDFLNSQKFTRDEILSMFRVPKAILGEVSASNRANTEAVEYIFSKYTIRPQLVAFVGAMNKYLVKPYDEKLELAFEDPVPKDKEAELKQLTQGVDKWITVDEARETQGLEPLPNKLGQVLYRPLGEMPLGTPPLPVTPKIIEVPKKKSVKDIEAEGMYKIAMVEKQAESFEQSFLVTSRKHFDAQQLLIQKNLNTLDGYKSYKKSQINDIFNGWEELSLEYQIALSEIYAILMAEYGQQSIEMVAGGVSFDYRDPNVVKFYESRSQLISTEVDATTQKDLRASLVEGLRDGEDIQTLSARMQHIFGSASDYRAKRIARTESIRTAGQADVEAWAQSGVVDGKRWFTVKDARVCPFCNYMVEKADILPVRGVYYKKGENLPVDVEQKDGSFKKQVLNFDFEDIISPPLHIQCRCTLLPIIQDAL